MMDGLKTFGCRKILTINEMALPRPSPKCLPALGWTDDDITSLIVFVLFL